MATDDGGENLLESVFEDAGPKKPIYVPDETLVTSEGTDWAAVFGKIADTAERGDAGLGTNLILSTAPAAAAPPDEPKEYLSEKNKEEWIRYVSRRLDAVSGKPVPDTMRLIALAIGYFESNYGVSKSWSFTNALGDIRFSYNVGATVQKPGQDWFPHYDTDAEGKPVARKFAAFGRMDDGLRNWLGVWGKPDTLSAAIRGDIVDVAIAMRGHGYYGYSDAAIPAYAAAIDGMAKSIAVTLGIPNSTVYREEALKKYKAMDAKPGGMGGPAMLVGGAAVLAFGLIYVTRNKAA